MSLEQPRQNNDVRMWLFNDWNRAIEVADTGNKLTHFNDVVTGRDAPPPEQAKHLVLEYVTLGGRLCDVYHWDQDQNGKIRNASGHRVFVHIKQ